MSVLIQPHLFRNCANRACVVPICTFRVIAHASLENIICNRNHCYLVANFCSCVYTLVLLMFQCPQPPLHQIHYLIMYIQSSWINTPPQGSSHIRYSLRSTPHKVGHHAKISPFDPTCQFCDLYNCHVMPTIINCIFLRKYQVSYSVSHHLFYRYSHVISIPNLLTHFQHSHKQRMAAQSTTKHIQSDLRDWQILAIYFYNSVWHFKNSLWNFGPTVHNFIATNLKNVLFIVGFRFHKYIYILLSF